MPGTHHRERVELAQLPSGTHVTTDVHVYDGAEDGPTTYVQGAVHGNEVNGPEVLRRLHERIDPDELAGRLIAVPIADPITFDRDAYVAPPSIDRTAPNLSTAWPGDASGSVRERMIARLWEYASEADAILDLHSGNPEMLSLVIFPRDDGPSTDLAEAFGTDVLLASGAASGFDPDAGGIIMGAGRHAGIPSIMPELGTNVTLDEGPIEVGVRGIENVLKHRGQLDGTPTANGDAIRYSKIPAISAVDSGLFVPAPDRSIGDRVSEGEYLGTLHDPGTFESLQTVETNGDGLLYFLRGRARTTADGRLANIVQREE